MPDRLAGRRGQRGRPTGGMINRAGIRGLPCLRGPPGGSRPRITWPVSGEACPFDDECIHGEGCQLLGVSTPLATTISPGTCDRPMMAPSPGVAVRPWTNERSILTTGVFRHRWEALWP